MILPQTIQAVFENGVFRPRNKLDLPEQCEVEVEVRQIKVAARKPSLDEIYAILAHRLHPEHQR